MWDKIIVDMKIEVVRLEIRRTHWIDVPTNDGYAYGLKSAAPIFCSEIGNGNVEYVAMLCMDINNMIINYSTIAIGEIDRVHVPYAQLVRIALLSNASKIIIAHNHPSGILKVTDYDIELTKKVGTLLTQLGLELIDSLVISGDQAVSIRKYSERINA